MSEMLKAAALDRAMALLVTSGVKYTIHMPDGTVRTNIEEKKCHRPKVNNWVKDYDVVNKVKATEVGGIVEFEVPCNRQEAFMKSFTATMIRYWGSGNYVVDRKTDRERLSALRV